MDCAFVNVLIGGHCCKGELFYHFQPMGPNVNIILFIFLSCLDCRCPNCVIVVQSRANLPSVKDDLIQGAVQQQGLALCCVTDVIASLKESVTPGIRQTDETFTA